MTKKKKILRFHSRTTHINRTMISLHFILIQIVFVMYSSGEIFDTFYEINDTLPSSTSLSTTRQTKDSMISLVDELNTYRNGKILNRIKQCDENLRLNDLCERYSVDNETNFLTRQSEIHFLTFDDLFDSLVNRSIVDKFDPSCLTNNDCSIDLSINDIQLTNLVILNRGKSFCSLEQCQPRLSMFIESCPMLSNPNITIPTLKLSPMLCKLYNEQVFWNSSQCIEGMVYFLHIFYAVSSQYEKCYVECTPECQTLKNIFTKLEQQCNDEILFTSQLSTFSWYQSINLREICPEEIFPRRPIFIQSIGKIVSLGRFPKESIYAISVGVFIIIFLLIFSLCCCMQSTYCRKKIRQRLNDDYQYRRLDNSSSIELGTHVENGDPTDNDFVDEDTQFDLRNRLSSSEHQRLLFVNS